MTQQIPPQRQLERSSAPLLVYLASLPRWIPFLTVVGLLGAGLLAGNALGGLIGFLSMGILGVLLGWLAYMSWPTLSIPMQAVRVLATGVVLALAVSYLLR